MFIPKLIVCLREGYSRKQFLQDAIAGITVGVVAIPLAMAFAIASGVTPDKGLYTAIVGGFFVSLLGGSRVQIGGPTGAFVVILYGIIQKHGVDGLALATFMAGGVLMLLGFLRLGSVIKFIPYPVITGFTSGIAVIIFSAQMRDLFGLPLAQVPADIVGKWLLYIEHWQSVSPAASMVGIISLIVLVLWRRIFPKIPAPMVVLVGATLMTTLLQFPVETIASRYGDMPHHLPAPHLPEISYERLRILLPDTLTIAFLGAIEALLSAVVADGMTGYNHKSNTELLAQGVANIASVLFGGIAVTGAIARTATNIKSGGKTPVAGIIHALTIVACLWWLAPLAGHIPLSVLAAILVVVAWNMSEFHHFIQLFHAPRADIAVLLLTFLLTVFVDLTTAVAVGVMVSTLLFVRDVRHATHIEEEDTQANGFDTAHLPSNVVVFELSGPVFFGSADRLKTVLRRVHGHPQYLILRMRKVPVIDASGLHALEQFLLDCKRNNITALFAEANEAVAHAIQAMHLGQGFATVDDVLTQIRR